MKSPGVALGLWFRRGFKANAKACAGRATLLQTVLLLENAPELGSGAWMPFGFFDTRGACVATLDAALLPLTIEGAIRKVGAIRAVATHPDWRGRGLFRALMEEALAWLEAESATLVLLYSAEPGIYRRFGFREVPQHAFVGPAPVCSAPEPARSLALDDPEDRRLIAGMLASRVPVSAHCALSIDPYQFIANLTGDPSLGIVHLTEAGALLVHEEDEQDLVIVDVVARIVPSIARLVCALNARPRLVKILFEPDLLGWSGQPILESTGLMIRGHLPQAMATPFMFPPTAEF